MTEQSAVRLLGKDKGLARSLLGSMGYTEDELSGRPIIGIANSWNTLTPGHFNLNQAAEFVKKGIYRGGGTAVEFGVIAACDGIANGHEGMKYILPSRDIIANSVEIMARAHQLDGLVLLASCDKIVPGMLMAAARLNLPAILVNGGPMMGGVEFDGRKSDATSVDEAMGMERSGLIGADEVEALEHGNCPGCGSCAFLGTANTMGCLTEAMGMSLPGSALVPAVYAERFKIAYYSGVKICELIERGIRTRDILTREALENGIRTALAICGSTNAVLHLSALAYEAELELDVVEEFERLSRETPQLARVNPAAKWDMEDFHKAGGIPRVMINLGKKLHSDVRTCTGKTLGENLREYRFYEPENPQLIRTMDNPFDPQGGIAVLRGNLAPDTAVTKPGAFDPSLSVFEGTARVFDCEEDANEMILAGKIKAGDVVVIRYEGPKGGPGMREMYKAMKFLYGMGLSKTTALITDGRFSGTNNGCFVGHISPEAAEGGTIAVVRDGDRIEINIPERRLTLKVSEEELRRRQLEWVPPVKDIPRGCLRQYARSASSANRGGVLL